jgi:hypothetical protein
MDPTGTTAIAKRWPEATRGRGWAWIALVAAVLLWVATFVTFGFAIVLAPIGFALSVVAWRRSSPRGGVFWVGFALNAVLLLGLADMVRGLLTGDVGVDFD